MILKERNITYQNNNKTNTFKTVIQCSLCIYGWMAEWLCSGLQSRSLRFDSGFSLQYNSGLRLNMIGDILISPSGGIGRHKGLKIPR